MQVKQNLCKSAQLTYDDLVARIPVALVGGVGHEFPALVAELVLDLVPQLDVPGQVLVRDEDAAHGARLLGHQRVLVGAVGAARRAAAGLGAGGAVVEVADERAGGGVGGREGGGLGGGGVGGGGLALLGGGLGGGAYVHGFHNLQDKSVG